MLAVGVVGLGYWGPNLARNVAGCSRTRLARLCDRDEERLTAVGERFPAAARSTDPKELFEDEVVEAVAIATPVATHYELAKEALLAGKHVLVEKPFTASTAEADELIELAARSGRILMVDHVFLYSPAVKTLARLVTSGELGRLQFVDSVRINLGVYQHDVNVIWDLAPHDLSIVDLLIGRPARSVMAVGSSHAGNGLHDVAYLHIDYGEGLHASIHVNWLSPVKIRHFLIGGTRRSVLYNDLDRSEPVKVYDRGVDIKEDPVGRRQMMVSYRSGDVVSPRVDSGEPLLAMIEHFAACVEDGAVPISGAEQGRRMVEILEAADRSLELGGRRIDLS